MKKKYYIIALLATTALSFSSCSEDFFDANPGDRVTEGQLEENPNPNALVNGMNAFMIQFNSLERENGEERHNDFGYMATALSMELWGDDMVQYTSNYGWYYDDYQYSNRGYEFLEAARHWNYFYKLIRTANDVLTGIVSDTEDPEMLAARGQAYAMRAFAHHVLVQLYQHTYKGHEDAPGIPIVTEDMTSEQLNNNPRKKVSEVYAQIENDLKQACELLKGWERPSSVYINYAVAKGFEARVHLCKEEWKEAAEAAEEAVAGFPVMDKAGLKEGFVSMDNNPSWMWSSDVTSQSSIAIGGITNFTSHVSSTAYGYATAGEMYKNISSELFNKIPDTDARKDWWCKSDSLVFVVGAGMVKLPKYANLKFGYYDTEGNNFNDLCYMRAEEMLLIAAEGYAMSGNLPQAKSILEDFVQTRQPDYKCTANSVAEMQNEVWVQRRIELWGEGFAWFDLKRLKKPIIRKYEGTNHNDDAMFDFPAEDPIFNLRIPRTEIQNNGGISETDNNPMPNV
ncbi:RagB/SusD family nutrient uptake outer membrane protein [Parabacteroides chinchillae]|uniref:SusD family protein n=1 Tax=Parabacteroides chinchillae TaxID=871327 RepID=A0A8G2F1W7_9BACT|nr:RagB/SusD family nutrient uptake outer membrane protein [Parabacteroides chinchillae]SEG04518.1 SusD family protein [Parabacteroides chinchillae]